MVRKRADAKVLCVRHVTCARPIVLRCRRQPCVTPRQESNTSICSVLHLRYCAWRSGFSAAGASNEDLDSAREPLTCGLPTPAPSYVWGARTRAPGSPPQRAVSLIMSSHAGCRALSRSGMQADWQPGVSCRARGPRCSASATTGAPRAAGAHGGAGAGHGPGPGAGAVGRRRGRLPRVAERGLARHVRAARLEAARAAGARRLLAPRVRLSACGVPRVGHSAQPCLVTHDSTERWGRHLGQIGGDGACGPFLP